MTFTPTQANRQISVTSDSFPTDALLLRAFDFEEQLGRPFTLNLSCQSPVAAPFDGAGLIGKTVTVNIELPSYTTRYIHGYVTSFQTTGVFGDLMNYRLVVRPALWMLSKSSHCRIFTDQSVPDIVKSVVEADGKTHIIRQLHSDYQPLKYCVQYNESDLAFVSRLLEASGIFYYFTHDADGSTMALCDHVPRTQTFPNYEKLPYNGTVGSPTSGPDQIYAWTVEHNLETQRVTLDAYSYENPKLDLRETDGSDGSDGLAIYEYTDEYHSSSHGAELAKLRLQEEASTQTVHFGETNSLGIAAGFTFDLTGYPQTGVDLQVFTKHVRLDVNSPSFESSDNANAGIETKCRFSTVPVDCRFRPARRTPRPRITGPQTAKVVSPSGTPSFDADLLGSIYVVFHWDRNATSRRVRVSQPSADQDNQSMFIPEVHSEVIVSFENGNPDHPIVTGRVYNQEIPPVLDPSASPNVTYFGNASQKNLLSMDATKGSENVVLQNLANKITMNSAPGSPSMVFTDGTSSITFDTLNKSVHTVAPGNNTEKTKGSTSKWTAGNWEEWTLGIKTSNVVGAAWNFYLGAYTKFVGGVDAGAVFGAKLELVTGAGYKITRGAFYKDTAAEVSTHSTIGSLLSKAWVKMVQTSNNVVSGIYTLTAGSIVQDCDNIDISAAFDHNINAGGSVSVESAGNLSMAGSEVDVSASNLSLTSLSDVFVSGPGIIFNAGTVEIG